MSDPDNRPTAPQVGSSLEAGFLLRVRSWRDVVPGVALGDCLRPATSLFAWVLFASALVVFSWADAYLPTAEPAPQIDPEHPVAQTGAWLDGATAGGLGPLVAPWIALLTGTATWQQLGTVLLRLFVFATIWVVPAGYMLRQSGLAMAGRLPMATGETLVFVSKRYPAYLAVFLIPLLMLFACWGYYALAAASENIPAVGFAIRILMRLAGIPLALVAGLIGFGSLVAIPLSWATISLERDGSSFDGLSRGYEYILRRPLQTCLYIAVACGVTLILTWLAQGVVLVTLYLTESSSDFPLTGVIWAGRNAGEVRDVAIESGNLTAQALLAVPRVAGLLVLFSLTSWLYLLLRRSTNHQEVEDVWEPPRPPSQPLPKLET